MRIHELIDDMLMKFDEKKLRGVCAVLAAVFLIDFAYSQIHPNAGKGVTDYTVKGETMSSGFYSSTPLETPRIYF